MARGVCLAGLALAASACASNAAGGSGNAASTVPGNATSTTAPTSTTLPPPPTHLTGAQPLWLCRPGLKNDPCTTPVSYTAVGAGGLRTQHKEDSVTDAPVDCFYVYPTVSAEKTTNANLRIETAETAVAQVQASQFSRDCNVWAPIYRQLTLQAILHPGTGVLKGAVIAYKSLLSAWQDYLANDNGGRPVVLIGHSQGAAILIRLLQTQFDANLKLRGQLVSAIILGGNVTVPVGKDVGGSFSHIPACGSAAQTGCVIAYSSFLDPPPANSLFGRPGKGVSVLSGQSATKDLQVLCVNPAAPGGGSAALEPLFPDGPSWVTYPGLYTGECKSAGGATWLQVTPHTVQSDRRPVVTQSLGPTWGLHLFDVNISLGDLVALVADEIAHFH